MSSPMITQQAAHTFLSKALDNYIHSNGKIRPHFLFSGKSGTGKSWLLEQHARAKGIPLLSINAAQLTREGISGNSLSKCLDPLRNYTNKPVIVFLDEFDKLFNGVNGGTGDERSGVQSEILHIISSGTCQVIGQYGHYDELRTNHVLFVFAGAFLGEENLSPEVLLKMGMFPELLGRVNLHVHLPPVDCEEMIKAMKTDPLLANYIAVNKTPKDKIADVENAIADRIREEFPTNVIGYRLIQRTIHQYFMYDGVFPKYEYNELVEGAMSKEDIEAFEASFQVERSVGE